ncbi:hypothetical protein A3H38_00395 [candidate division WOR-1 bacterium RIFCSPLOWO2_02_FULL_46_20]|uniref:Uncharacterized protein n=2 Tax=Saganbacteria TaxID=1703751 RepID=A0A1F4RFT0_UNCSA|nr:MAG: hypothetical protein A3H38_00395 [candidate division WOR-1 bacterium RIFCSPLOWO2_02_FULL_46_20]OGC09503.1 MAG: hypothetical protein A3F86_02695 [candidate division WOR-1 bacterium RIFCSPLOWO2_12_FULL_45_9]
MKRVTVIMFAAGLILCSIAWGEIKDPINLPIDKLYATPSKNSKVIFDVPMEVKLLDVSPDINWYKVKISYSFGPFKATHIGWAEIPIADTLVEKHIVSQYKKILAEE